MKRQRSDVSPMYSTSVAQRRAAKGGVLQLLDPVFELNPLSGFGQSIGAIELPPFFLSDIISLKTIDRAVLLLF